MMKISPLKFVIAVVFILAATGLTYTVLEFSKTADTELLSGETDRISKTDISDWKTYRNEEYGFEVKYPLYWKDQKTSEWGLVTFYDPHYADPEKNWHNGGLVNILVLKNPNQYSLRDLLKKMSMSSVKEIIFDDIQAFEVRVHLQEVKDGVRRNTYIADKRDSKRIYLASLDYPGWTENEIYDKAYDAIVPTFRFVK